MSAILAFMGKVFWFVMSKAGREAGIAMIPRRQSLRVVKWVCNLPSAVGSKRLGPVTGWFRDVDNGC